MDIWSSTIWNKLNSLLPWTPRPALRPIRTQWRTLGPNGSHWNPMGTTLDFRKHRGGVGWGGVTPVHVWDHVWCSCRCGKVSLSVLRNTGAVPAAGNREAEVDLQRLCMLVMPCWGIVHLLNKFMDCASMSISTNTCRCLPIRQR